MRYTERDQFRKVKLPRYPLNPEFWQQFPDSECNFRSCVERGIWIEKDEKFILPTPPEGYQWLPESDEDKNNLTRFRLWFGELRAW